MAKLAKKPAKKRQQPQPKLRPPRAAKQKPAIEKTRRPVEPRADTKGARVIAMLTSPAGATITAMMQETGWQAHSVRGFLAGVVRKKLKLKLQSSKVDGQRIYRVDADASPDAPARSFRRQAD